MAAALVTGCGSSDSGTGSNGKTAEETGEAAEPYTVAIQLVNISTDLTDIEMVEEAINEITVPEINCKVDIQNVFIGDLPTMTSMNIISGDKMDIVCVGLTQKLSDIADDGILLPLDDYLQYAPTYTGLVKEYIGAGIIGGVQYAIPVNPYAAQGKGFVYNKDMADEYGIALEDGAGYEELTEAFAVLKEQGIYGTSNGEASSLNAQFWYNIELFGTNGDYGMIADPANSTKIESFYGSDIFKEYCNQMKAWTEAGFMPADSLTDTTIVQEYFSRGTLFGTVTDYNMAQFATWQAGKSFNIDMIEMQEALVTTSSVVERMWGLASTCENPQKAMEFLEYMYVNPEVANLLQYGIEGQHYTIAEGTENVATGEGAATGTAGYTSIFTQFGNPVEILAAAPNTDSYADDVLAYNKEVAVSETLGYTFDVSEYFAEAGAVANVIAEYLPRLQTGQVKDMDEYLAEFLSELERAGYNEIIAGNQKQLEAFLVP